jgi:hypothetical protein
VGIVVDKLASGTGFSPSTSVLPCQCNSTGAPLHGKGGKKVIIFITGLHNKPQGCGASVASAAGRCTTKTTTQLYSPKSVTHNVKDKIRHKGVPSSQNIQSYSRV